ncbi:DUF1461 domain-containing protein [Adlercreutzia murintestinalis]|uniref:lipoprotein intramolecular transacylase Lit n=1 Tax=Adlercreutzia murintestinalis TaxID=2941325 RepID=UPI002040C942|nr:DUF1461 domain-containing protein [Adlercreutzia murintestinalis]
MSTSAQKSVMQVITAIMLALTYFAAGFALCAGIPATTGWLSSQTSLWEGSPFTAAQMQDLALATRDYTVSGHDRAALTEALAHANEAANTPYAALEGEQLISQAPDAYTLDADALAHLDDVYEVVSRFTMPLLGVALISAFCLMALLRMFGYRPVGVALVGAGGAVLVLFAALGIWASIGFDGLFTNIHTLFFADGSWVFPADSLLIRMYPHAFWVGMGGIWLASSCVLAALSLVIGALMLRAAKKRAAARTRTSSAAPAAQDAPKESAGTEA